MATWQFDLSAVRAESGTSLPTTVREPVETFLDGLLDKSEEPGGWLMFGPADGNRIDLAFDEDACELDVRVDARTDAEGFISTACVLMTQLGCTFYCAELDEFVPANVGAVKDAIQRSDAWRYALDPAAFMQAKARG